MFPLLPLPLEADGEIDGDDDAETSGVIDCEALLPVVSDTELVRLNERVTDIDTLMDTDVVMVGVDDGEFTVFGDGVTLTLALRDDETLADEPDDTLAVGELVGLRVIEGVCDLVGDGVADPAGGDIVGVGVMVMLDVADNDRVGVTLILFDVVSDGDGVGVADVTYHDGM